MGLAAERLKISALAAVIVLAALLAWSNSFNASFHFDDHPSIEDNAALADLSKIGAILKTQERTSTLGRPLANLSFALNRAVAGPGVAGYHAVNLALHVFAALALFGFLRRVLNSPKLAPAFGQGADSLAFSIALLWCVHPLQTAAVTYLVQRVEVLASLFYLLALYSFARSAEGGQREGRWSVIAVISCLCAFASKEMSASLPLAALLCDRAFYSGSFRGAWERRRNLHLALFSSWALLAFLALSSGTRNGTAFSVDGMTPLVYFQTQWVAITRYLALSFWPQPLVFDYGMPKVESFAAAAPYGALLALLFAATLYGLKKNHPAGFCGAVFFGLLAPSSSILPIRETIFEYRVYLPLAALLTLPLAGASLLARRFIPDERRARLVPLAAALVFAPLLAGLTYARNADYRTEAALWRDTAAKRPQSARAARNLGVAEFQEGRLVEAERELKRAIELGDRANLIYLTLGASQNGLGKFEEAVFNLALAHELAPEDSETNFEYGFALLSAGRRGQGMERLREVAGSGEATEEVHRYVAGRLFGAGFSAEAREYLSIASQAAARAGDLRAAAALADLLTGPDDGGSAK